jgi:LytTr DNA-binding domain
LKYRIFLYPVFLYPVSLEKTVSLVLAGAITLGLAWTWIEAGFSYLTGPAFDLAATVARSPRTALDYAMTITAWSALYCGAGDYSDVFTNDGQKILTTKPLREWEERLPEKYFYRIHRSTIINLEYVDRVERWFNRAYRVHLHHISEPLVMSRRYAARLRSKYG